MPRYITEYKIQPAGGKIKIPTCARFIGVVKVSTYFVLMAEIWGDPGIAHEIDVKVFHNNEYLLSEYKYIGYTVVGTLVFHFAYLEGPVEDLGGDGGTPETSISKEVKPSAQPVNIVRKPKDFNPTTAGGMEEK